ncbi:DUF547 domain-containing protein [Hyphobacterium sp. CCMP332]|nr:DUF547 domain-containing protein [Hyphobacterium sp. CCMP332]
MDAHFHFDRNYFWTVLAFFILTFITACAVPERESKTRPISHNLWTEVLQDIVMQNGKVDYQRLINNPKKFNAYINTLKENHPDRIIWNSEEKLSYWINAYNAFTLQLIIDNYPLSSIKDLNSSISIPFVNTIWDKPFILISDFSYSLNDIEHGILRKQFNEPRIHFAINCASVSCPNLRNEAYTAENLNRQLNMQSRLFISDETKNLIDNQNLKISKIFSWFGSDFTKNGTLIEFLNKYSDVEINENAEISYNEYDWSLNDSNGH